MNNIEELSIFGTYKQKENIVTSALLQILKKGGTEFIRFVLSEINEIDFPDSEISVTTQIKENNNVYDGLLKCSFSFKVIVESKISPQAINIKQLEGLLSNIKSPTSDYILYITPDRVKPVALGEYEQIYWVNWKEINAILKRYDTVNNPVLEYLIIEFDKYLISLKLLEVTEPKDRVLIAAGSWGEPVAREYMFYACQNNRTARKSGFIAFYNKKKINYLFEVIEGPVNDIDLLEYSKEDEQVKLYLENKEQAYEKGDLRQFYKLKLIEKGLNISHQGKTKSGKNSAYTMGVFRYTTKSKILAAKTTDDL